MNHISNEKITKDRAAIAAYNFVPLPDKLLLEETMGLEGLPPHDYFLRGLFTGRFEVELETKSPLYIRAGLTKEEFRWAELQEKRFYNPAGLTKDELKLAEQKGKLSGKIKTFRGLTKNKPDFFYINKDTKEPLIPGSSLRGMLRMMVNIISYGKMTQVDKRKLLYRSVGDPGALGVHYRQQMSGLDKTNIGNDHPLDQARSAVRGGYLIKTKSGYKVRPACSSEKASFFLVAASTVTRDLSKVPAENSAQPVIMGKVDFTHSAGKIQTIQPFQADTKISAGLHVGNLIVTKTIGKRHWYPVINKHENDNSTDIEIPSELWRVFDEDQNKHKGINNRKIEAVTDVNNATPQNWADAALFYLVNESGLAYLGTTRMFRLPFLNDIHDLIPESLHDPLVTDITEAMFGFIPSKSSKVSEKNRSSQGYATRLSFCSARLIQRDADLYSNDHDSINFVKENHGVTDVAVLSSANPTCSPHYYNQSSTNKRTLNTPDSPLSDQHGSNCGKATLIRGTKFYLHKGVPSITDLRPALNSPQAEQGIPNDNSKIYTQFKPVIPGATFKFTIHFKNLREAELGAICWALQPRGAEDKEYVHSLGMGKPLGMGAIKLTPQLILSHCVSQETDNDGDAKPTRYEKLFDDDGSWYEPETIQSIEQYAEFSKTFEKAILASLSKQGSLADQPRIAILLKLLEWPGFAPKYASSMHLKRFKDSRILPDPRYDFTEITGDLRQPPPHP